MPDHNQENQQSEWLNWLQTTATSSTRSMQLWLSKSRAEVEESLNRKTSLAGGDDITRLQTSDNPLLTLDQRSVPPHIRSAALYLATASGLFANADEVTRFTRDVMDRDDAAVQQWLRRVFDPEEAREISMWMDTAPGAEHAGGWAHRLDHGHDLSALATLGEEHGVTGAVEWTNHVWLRDFWTPHGVPYLPAGSGSAYEWLIEAGVSPATAMSLLTVNAAEMATGILAFSGGRRLYKGLKSYTTGRDYRRRVDRIRQLAHEGSHNEAVRLVDNTETFAVGQEVPRLRLDLAVLCLDQSFKVTDEQLASAWGSRAFQIAFDLCRSLPHLPDDVPYHGGTRVSFHGFAATIAASAYSFHVQTNQSDWQQVVERLQFGVNRFLELSAKQSKTSSLQLKGKDMWGYAPYSAMTNQLMALELVTACGGALTTTHDPIAIRREMENTLMTLKADKTHRPVAVKIDDELQRSYPLKNPGSS